MAFSPAGIIFFTYQNEQIFDCAGSGRRRSTMGFDKKRLKKISVGYDTTVYRYDNLSVVTFMSEDGPGLFYKTISIAAHGSERSVPEEDDVRGILETLGMDLTRPIERGLGLSVGPCPCGHRFYYTQPLSVKPAV